MSDRSRDTGDALTKIRNVRGQALDAIAAIGTGDSESRHIDAHMDDDGEYVKGYFQHFRDPDADEMVSLLQDFVDKTAKFARKGKR